MHARILIVEDNAANLELVEYLLKACGYNTLVAIDGAEAMRQARAHRPDMILCDLEMPILNGYQVLEQLRADPAFSAIPVIAVTAFSMPDDHAQVLRAGFDGYLTKPIDPERFIGQIEKYLRHELRSGGSVPDPTDRLRHGDDPSRR